MKKITIIYVLIGLISCFICSVVTPPKFYPDENHHYFRVISLSEGILFPHESVKLTTELFWYSGFTIYKIKDSKTGYNVFTVAKSHIQFIEAGLQLKDLWSEKNTLDNSQKVSIYLENTKHYLFTGYVIPAIMYGIVSQTTKNLYLRLICTRFLTGLFFISVIAFCIYTVKRYSLVVFTVATLPITHYLISSLAPDGILITSSLLTFVLVINILEEKESFKISNKIKLLFSTFLLSFTKPGYFIWSFLVWILVLKDKKWVYTSISISLFSILTCVIPYFLLSKFYPSPTPDEILKLSQYSFIELWYQPNEILKRIGVFIMEDSILIGKQMLCTYAWTRFYLPEKIYFVYVVVLFLCLSYKEDKPVFELSHNQKYILFGVVVLGGGFILFAFLMIKDCLGICGVQGRYFLPYLPALFLLIHTLISNKKLTIKLIYHLSIIGIFLLNLFANAYLCYIFYYYWN